MSKALLCLGMVAQTPFKVNKLGSSVFTIEELCYVLGENAYLVDESVLSLAMVDWIRQGCGLEDLADALERTFSDEGRQVSVSSFLEKLFSYTGYYDRETIEKTSKYLLEAAKLSPEERVKNAADYLAKEGYYKQALKLYKQQSDRLGKEHPLASKLCHNMGCVYVKLFLYNRASELFMDSFMLSGNRESLVQAMAAKRLSMSDREYVEWVTNIRADISGASEELERRMKLAIDKLEVTREMREKSKSLLEIPDGEETIVDIVDRLKEEYRTVG